MTTTTTLERRRREGADKGSDCCAAAANQILHLKAMLHSQLTAMEEQQFVIEQLKKERKDYKDECDMVGRVNVQYTRTLY